MLTPARVSPPSPPPPGGAPVHACAPPALRSIGCFYLFFLALFVLYSVFVICLIRWLVLLIVIVVPIELLGLWGAIDACCARFLAVAVCFRVILNKRIDGADLRPWLTF